MGKEQEKIVSKSVKVGQKAANIIMTNSNSKKARAKRLEEQAAKFTEQADRARNFLPVREARKRKAAKQATAKAHKIHTSATSKHKRYLNQK